MKTVRIPTLNSYPYHGIMGVPENQYNYHPDQDCILENIKNSHPGPGYVPENHDNSRPGMGYGT
jgi:hypothetical protein